MTKFESEILEEILTLSGDKDKWHKEMLRVKHGDNPITLDIRYMNGSKMGKGISLTEEECFLVGDELLRRGYCTDEAIRDVIASSYNEPSLNDIKSMMGRNLNDN